MAFPPHSHILPQRQIQCRQRIGHVQVHSQQAGHREPRCLSTNLQNLISRDAQQLFQHPIGHLKAGNHAPPHEAALRGFFRVEILSPDRYGVPLERFSTMYRQAASVLSVIMFRRRPLRCRK